MLRQTPQEVREEHFVQSIGTCCHLKDSAAKLPSAGVDLHACELEFRVGKQCFATREFSGLVTCELRLIVQQMRNQLWEGDANMVILLKTTQTGVVSAEISL